MEHGSNVGIPFLVKIVTVSTVVVLLSDTHRQGVAGEATCSADEQACVDGECILTTWWCDGDPDCSHGEDEHNCPPPDCAKTEFRCNNDHCIQDILVCNGDDDCQDLSDEKDCGVPAVETCPDGQFLCADHSRCILDEWVCDLKTDCDDESDESKAVCGDKSCTSTEFACLSGHQCIVGRWRCDGLKDCADGSDEDSCDDVDKEPCDVYNGQFQCENGTCISLAKVCDGITHCGAGEDEGQDCANACDNSPCDQRCLPTPLGPACICYEGYQLNTDQKTCSDIDECDGFNQQKVCSQICVNFAYSYHCDCQDGYRLLSDKHTCKATDRDFVMLYAQLHEVRSIDMQTRETKSLVTKRNKITDIAYNHLGMTGTLFWTDEEDSAVYSADIDQHSQGSAIPSVTEGLSRPQGITIDWLSALLYITDSGLGQIIACEMLDTDCAVLVTLPPSDSPASIVVDPSRGYMYWSSLGKSPYIAKGSMDGLDYQKIVTTDLQQPTGLFLDHTTERLFWADSKLGQISSLRFDGTGPKHVLTVEGSPFSVGVFEDRVIWSDLQSSSIMVANKFSGKGLQRLVKTMQHPRGLSLVHSTFYKHASTPCDTANHCSHICLLSRIGQDLNSTCVCPVGFHFSADGTSCEDSFTNPFLLVSRHEEIMKIDLRRIGKSAEQPYKDSMRRVVAIDFDPHRKAAIYSDISRGVIGAMNLYITGRPSEEVVVEELNGTVVGLAVDWVAANLYWVDSTKRSIEVAKLNGSSHITLKEDVDGNPTAIVLDLKKGVLYYAVRGDQSAVVKCEMTGTNCNTMVTDVEECHGLALDDVKERLLWTDQSKGHIGAIDTDGQHQKILVPDLTSPYSVAILGDVVFWTDTESDNLHRFSLATNKRMRNLLTGYESMMGLSLVKWDRFSSVINACSNNNGGCSHLCLARGVYDKKCACPVDWELQPDGQCIQNTMVITCRPDQLQCDRTLCLPLTSRCDGIAHCGDGVDELDCNTPLSCPPQKFQCVKGGEPDCVSNSWRCDRQEDCDDGSDEEGCVFECSSFEFTCEDKDCVPHAVVCDGIPDCEDSSDEQDCPVTTTPTIPTCASAEMYGCGDGHCIDHSQVCDGRLDCSRGEDEDQLCIGTPEPCDDHSFQCGDGRCITASYRCDGDPDCEDESDEDPVYCTSHHPIETKAPPTTPSVPCTEDTFVCESGQCISKQRLCDGAYDCEDRSDEKGDCNLQCGDLKCSERCIQSPSGPVCMCNLPGYELMDDRTSCKDVDECNTVPPKCSQQCENTPGSFICRCAEGYFLEEDYTGCKADGARPKLLVGRRHEISELTEHGHHLYNIVTKIRGSVTSLDIIQASGDIFWINSLGFLKKWTKGTGFIFSLKRNLTPVFSVAFDWLTGNVYITGVRKVIVCSGELTYCSILLHPQVNPLGMALYPNKGLMFWTRSGLSAGESGGLVRCWMTGDHCQAIMSSGLLTPVSLTIDYPQERIYLLDQFTGTVHSSDFNGKHRWSFPRLGKLSSLDVFEDWLYLTDIHNKTLIRIHKYGVDSREVLHKSVTGHMTVRVVQPLRQPKGQNPCLGLKCSHLCLLSPIGGQCECPVDYGFQGSSSTECSDCASYCMNGASCNVYNKKIFCVCQPGFSGDQCSVRNLPSPVDKPLVLATTHQQFTSTTEHQTTTVPSTRPIDLTTAEPQPVTDRQTPLLKPKIAISSPDDRRTSPSDTTKSEIVEENTGTPDDILIFNNAKSTVIVPLAHINKSANVTKASGVRHEDNHAVVAGVVVSLILTILLVLIVLVVIWKKGKKPTLSKLVWYHKGTSDHSKIEDQESLVQDDGIRNPTFEAQDINFNTEKSKILRYPSDSSVDSAFISTGNGLSQFDENSGSTCRLIPSDNL